MAPDAEATISAQCPKKPLVPLHSCLQLNEPLLCVLLNEVAKSKPSLMALAFHSRKGVTLITYQTFIWRTKILTPSTRLSHFGKLGTWKEQIWLCLLIWFSTLEAVININAKLEGETWISSGRKSAQKAEGWISQNGQATLFIAWMLFEDLRQMLFWFILKK